MKQYQVKRVRFDNAGEHRSAERKEYCRKKGIEVRPSPACAPESNGIIERLVQEHWARARGLLYTSDLPFSFRERLYHMQTG